jgi:hypothetical protein
LKIEKYLPSLRPAFAKRFRRVCSIVRRSFSVAGEGIKGRADASITYVILEPAHPRPLPEGRE